MNDSIPDPGSNAEGKPPPSNHQRSAGPSSDDRFTLAGTALKADQKAADGIKMGLNLDVL
ncbi:MAG: hypothetical protein GY773_33410 [Actinomycetia bacterium]|nr:hypothetical protein [Actinomycetes bacterium]MCP5031180.1 hypothetical protein [Actinomycetes bacterium]